MSFVVGMRPAGVRLAVDRGPLISGLLHWRQAMSGVRRGHLRVLAFASQGCYPLTGT